MQYLPCLVKIFLEDFAATESNLTLIAGKDPYDTVCFFCEEYNKYYELGHESSYYCEGIKEEFLKAALEGIESYLKDWQGLKRIMTSQSLQAVIDIKHGIRDKSFQPVPKKSKNKNQLKTKTSSSQDGILDQNTKQEAS